MNGPRRSRFKSDRLARLQGHSNTLFGISVEDFVNIGSRLKVKQKILISHEIIYN